MNRFACCRVSSHARDTLPDLENAKAADADTLTLLKVLYNIPDQVDEDCFGPRFRERVIRRKARREVLQCHSCCWLRETTGCGFDKGPRGTGHFRRLLFHESRIDEIDFLVRRKAKYSFELIGT